MDLLVQARRQVLGLTMADVELRRAQEDDFSEVMSLERKSFPLDAYPDEVLRRRMIEYPQGFLVALQDGKIVGYIAAWVVSRKARIDSMAIDEQYRRRGIGSLMLDTVLDHFKRNGHKTVELKVRPTNTGAIKLYATFGFQVVGVEPRYYQSDGSDAFLMSTESKD